jgi:hypothetical protein
MERDTATDRLRVAVIVGEHPYDAPGFRRFLDARR